jgi:peptide deformylase
MGIIPTGASVYGLKKQCSVTDWYIIFTMSRHSLNPKTLELVMPSDAVLSEVAQEVTPSEITTDFIQGVISRMLELSAGKGHSKSDSRQMVGLAAVQLGVSKRIVSIDVTATGQKQEQNLEIFINPKIIEHSMDLVDGREGCWSCGNVCGNVARHSRVTVEALDSSGKPFKRDFVGFVARIAQHEIDHLDGVRFPERIPVDQSYRMHWVEPAEFERYRNEWQNWPRLCSREQWESVKTGA